MVRVSSIAAGEYAENEIRKNFTPSERVAIGKALEAGLGNRQGQRTDKELPVNCPEVARGVETREIAAKRSGFDSAKTYERAKKVVEQAVEEVVAQMDAGQLAISSAALIADEPPERQREIANLEESDRRREVRKIRRQKDLPTPSQARKLARERGKAILDRKLQWQTGMSPAEREPLIEKSHAIVAVIEAVTALNTCSLPASEVALGIRDLDTPDMDFVGRCRKAALFLSQIEKELNA
jgi:ParB family chromosome partitioning protein